METCSTLYRHCIEHVLTLCAMKNTNKNPQKCKRFLLFADWSPTKATLHFPLLTSTFLFILFLVSNPFCAYHSKYNMNM